jgi:1,2-diacylglycerol 3-alpha-glucosyltransferase
VRTVVIFDNFGPYHRARLSATATRCELTAIQVSGQSAKYAWDAVSGSKGFRMATLFPGGVEREANRRTLQGRMERALDEAAPQVVFIPGWSSASAFVALRWCVRRGVPAVAMCESTAWDEARFARKEFLKRKLVSLFSAALVGGNPHRDYLVGLGMPTENIFLGYDAVENDHFARNGEAVRARGEEVRSRHGLPENYFLASARFIPKKNLSFLLEAYAHYRKKASDSIPWSLVLLGDGPLRGALENRIGELQLRGHVLLPGFRQYADLPAYYALARVLVHASTTEQWGLVVNEAMASGLPVLVSNRSGCAADLVQEGVNGFTFDPREMEQLVELMLKISDPRFPLTDFGAASVRIVADWGPERFALELKAAAECALQVKRKKPSFLQRIILQALMARSST